MGGSSRRRVEGVPVVGRVTSLRVDDEGHPASSGVILPRCSSTRDEKRDTPMVEASSQQEDELRASWMEDDDQRIEDQVIGHKDEDNQ